MLGIPKYKPQFFSDAISFLNINKHYCESALHKTFSTYYVQWNTEFNEWNNDGLIIIVIDSIQYEFTAFQLSEYSMTINTIDLSKKLDWYGADDEIPLIWKEAPFDQFNVLKGKLMIFF